MEQIDLIRNEERIRENSPRNDSMRTFKTSFDEAKDGVVERIESLYYSGDYHKALSVVKNVNTKSLSTQEYIQFLHFRYKVNMALGHRRRVARDLRRLSRETKYFHFLQSGSEFKRLRLFLENGYGNSLEKISLRLLSDFPYTESSLEALKYIREKYKGDIIPYKIVGKAARLASRDDHIKEWVEGVVKGNRIDYGNLAKKELVLKTKLLSRLRLFDLIIKDNDDILSRKMNPRYKSEQMTILARAYDALGQPSEAKKTVLQGLDLLGRNKKTARLWGYWNGRLARQGDFVEAFQEQSKLVRYQRGRINRWRHFWYAYRAGKYLEANKIISMRSFRGLDRSFPAMKTYWKSKVARRLGQSEKALDLENKILKKWGAGYYSMQVVKAHLDQEANSKAGEKGKMVPIVSKVLSSKFDVREWFYGQSLLLSPGHRSMNKIVEDINANPGYWEVKYPRPYWEDVHEIARFWNYDPLLTYSFMRAESFYNTHVKSPVGAVGLMQIMPYTGNNISKELGDSRFKPKDLFNPRINIRYGSFYISKLISYYKGNLYHAAAAYNAGPLKVNEWRLSCKTCEDDEFVESIPYRETRRYVKKVLRNYTKYKRIYDATIVPDLLLEKRIAKAPIDNLY